MKLTVKDFGKFNGKTCLLYTMETPEGASVSVTDFAGAVTAIRVPDKKGVIDDVVPGFDDVKQYITNPGCLGALIGPVGNRVSGAEFTLNGVNYAFTPNEGTTLLHCGKWGFNSVLWESYAEMDEREARVVLKHEFKQADTGFPGNLQVTVTYTFNSLNSFKIAYHVDSDAESFVSPTNHTYFNIAGLGGKHIPSIGRQTIQIFADNYTKVKAGCIPVGTEKVDGTPFDLREPVKIKDGLLNESTNEQMTIGAGYDHNFVLSGEADMTGLRHAATVEDARSGRIMKVYTDMPAVQFYSANHLKRYSKARHCYFNARDALCLETQSTPDSIHHEGEFGFNVAHVGPGKPFDSVTVYEFSVKTK